jgi:hypothetical protein
MYKIVTLRINGQMLQCELIDEVTEHFKTKEFLCLYSDVEISLSFLDNINPNEREELAELIKNEQLYYRLKPIEFYYFFHNINANPPLEAEPFMEAGIATPLAIQVFENIYYSNHQKETLLRQIEAGELVFSIYHSDSFPTNARPLLEFDPSESTKIKAESKKILQSYRLQSLKDKLLMLISNVQFDLSAIIKFLYLAFFTYAAAQNSSRANPRINYLGNDLCVTNRNNKSKPWQTELLNHINTKNLIKNAEKIDEMIQRFSSPQNLIQRENFLSDAIQNDDLDKFKQALQQGYDLHKLNSQGTFTLMQAAKYNSYRIIHYVAKTLKIDLNSFQKLPNPTLEDSWLITAMDSGNDLLARKLIKWGVDIDSLFLNRQSLLHYLAGNQDNPQKNLFWAKKLVSLGANINVLNLKQVSPVFFAVILNNIEMVKFYLDSNCKTSLANLKYNNLLSTSLLYSSLETVEFLLKEGLDPYLNIEKFINGESVPLLSMPIAAMLVKDIAVIDLMIRYNLNLSKYPKINIELLFSLFRHKKVPIAYYLVKRGLAMEYFHVVWSQLENKDFPEAEVIRPFVSTITEWEKSRNNLKQQSDIEIIKNYFHLDPEILEIPQFLSFYKAYCEIKNACKENNIPRFKTALARLKLIPELTNEIKHIEAESSEAEISSSLMNAFRTKEEKSAQNITFFMIMGTEISTIILMIFILKLINSTLQNQQQPEPPLLNNTHNELPIIDTINNCSNDKKIDEDRASKDLDIHPKRSSEYLKIVNQLQLINEYIETCKFEKNFFLTEDRLLFIRNRSNTWFKEHKKVELERDYRKLQIKLNHKITALQDKVNYLLEFKIADKLQIINACQTMLEDEQDQLNHSLLNYSENEKISVHDEKKYIEQIKSFKETRNEFQKLWKEAENMVDEIEQLKKEIEKQKLNFEIIYVENKQPKSDIISIKSTLKKPISENNVVKGKQKERKSTTNSNLAFFIIPETIEKIKEDSRVHFANELFCIILLFLIEKNEEYNLESKPDAALYLLMKTSHLIAQLTSPKFGYKTIILPNQYILYNLRNNIVHYPELCFEKTNVMLFLNLFHKTFNEALQNLKIKGACDMIDTRELERLCPFLFEEHRNDLFINEADQSLENCLDGIIILIKKSKTYYIDGAKLEKEEKYANASILHCAMHGLVLQFREKMRTLNRLDSMLFKKINRLIPKIICSGHQIAHQLKEEDSWQLTNEEREYYAQEDIPPFSLLKLIKGIVDKETKILSLCMNNQSQSLSYHQ